MTDKIDSIWACKGCSDVGKGAWDDKPLGDCLEHLNKKQLLEWLEGEKQEYDPNNAYEAAYTISHNAAIDTIIEKVKEG